MFVISSHFFLIVDNPGGSQRTHLLSGLLSPGYASHNFLVLHFCVEYTTSVMIFAMKWLFKHTDKFAKESFIPGLYGRYSETERAIGLQIPLLMPIHRTLNVLQKFA